MHKARFLRHYSLREVYVLPEGGTLLTALSGERVKARQSLILHHKTYPWK